MSQVIQVTSENWKETITSSKKLVVIEFYTPTCPYCARLTPLFKKLSNEYADKMIFAMVNAVENQDLASGYGIMGVPTLKFLCAGRPVAELAGFKSEKELRQAFDEALIKFPECVEKRSPLYI